MTNLYQTSSGTPVTADGQPVGLVLDKSKGDTLGSELITNGTFDTDISGWVNHIPSRAVISYDNGTLKVDNTTGTGDGYIEQTGIPMSVGSTYIITATFSNTTDSAKLYLADSSGETISNVFVVSLDSNGTASLVIPVTNPASNGILIGNNDQSTAWNIDNVSVKEVLGNYAVQPTASSRPTYNANPDRLTLDLVDDGLLVDIPTGGWDGYMTVGTDLGTATYGVSLPEGNYELGGDYFFGNTINNVLFREGEMQPAHRQAIEQIFVDEGAKASYGDVTSFANYWRGKNITEFPLIDTSSGTTFYAAWYGNDLTEFPLIDTSNVTNFFQTWLGNELASFPLIDTSSGTNFTQTWRINNLTSFPALDFSSATNISGAWWQNSLTSFPLIDTSNVTNFSTAWRQNNLTSFPLIDTSSGTTLFRAWENNQLTSFPLIDTSNVTDFGDAWARNNLTSFPSIDTSSGTYFGYTWQTNNLTSFPALDLSNGGYFRAAWRSNVNLTDFPANMFDNCGATNFDQAFTNTNLSQESIDNILVSIESNGTSNGTFGQSGGSAPSSVGESAITALRSRGWTITVTGGF